MLVLFLSAHAFVCAAARPVPVATTLIAVGVSVMRFRVILDDFFRDLVEDLAPHLLIFLDLLALTSSAISHERPLSFGEPQPTWSKECATSLTNESRPKLGFYDFPRPDFMRRSSSCRRFSARIVRTSTTLTRMRMSSRTARYKRSANTSREYSTAMRTQAASLDAAPRRV